MDLRVVIFTSCFVLAASSSCRFPGAPAHSTVQFSDEGLSEGTVATYSCERGFELLGPSRRICGPDASWTPEGIPFCVLNVAAGKAPMQISTDSGGIPQRAIDGSTSGFFNPETCTLTKPEKVPWWYVNLLEPYMVQLVRLDFGKPCCGTSKPAVIVVRVGNNRPDLGTNPVCNRFSGFLEEGQPLFLPCNPPMPGAFVSVHLEVSQPSQLSICEAFVYTDQALPIERCPQFRELPPGSTATYNGKCYIFYNRQPAKFLDALAFCSSRGGTLVNESNPALQGFISWELWRRHRSDSSSQYWMGAVRDQNDKTNWKWLNGEDVTVSFWNSPVSNEDCARFDGSKGWLWSDTNCQKPLNFICQHQPKACGRPEQPPNSTMSSEDFDVGATVEYSCDDGHLLVGPTSRTCLDTGFYNEFPPVCKRIECGYPAEIQNGGYELVNGSVGYLSHVVYGCDDGYEMAGRARLVCDFDQKWNGPPPRCEIVQCEEPLPIANGEVTLSSNSSVFGTYAEYACGRGFKLVGSERVTCQPNGQWDRPAPLCKPEERPTTVRSTSTTSEIPTSSTHRPLIINRITRPPIIRQPATPAQPAPFSPPPPTETQRPSRRPTAPPRTSERPRTTQRVVEDAQESGTSHTPHIIVASHPRDNQILTANSNNIRSDQIPRVNVPLSVDGERKDVLGAKLNLGAIIALGAFAGLVFLVAIITSIIILVRRNHSAKHYRHHVSPDCNTVASFDSSSSESRAGLNRYYRQAWENLHEAAGSKAHAALHRKEPMEDAGFRREAMKDGSELVVSDAYPGREKRRTRRHHHHHRDLGRPKDWRGHDPHNHRRY